MARPQWACSQKTYIWIFNTGRGLSICVRLPHNLGVIYDLGTSDDFSPAEFIEENIAPYLTKYLSKSIAQCFLSHPHQDHICEMAAIADDSSILSPSLLTCPNDKAQGEKVDFARIANKKNKEMIDKYRNLYNDRNPPLRTLGKDVSCNVDVEYGFYYLVPPSVGRIHPSNDHHYGNGLSLVMYLKHGSQSILIPGDVTPDVLKCVIDGIDGTEKRYTVFNSSFYSNTTWREKTSNQPTLKQLLQAHGLSVLVAPHHGLESCYSEKLFETMKDNKPLINVISEKRHLSDSDGIVDGRYQHESGAKGLYVNIEGRNEKRYSVSTRNGQHILVVFDGTSDPKIYLRQDPNELLSVAL